MGSVLVDTKSGCRWQGEGVWGLTRQVGLSSSRGGEVGRGGDLPTLGRLANQVPHKALSEKAVKLDVGMVLQGRQPEVTPTRPPTSGQHPPLAPPLSPG